MRPLSLTAIREGSWTVLFPEGHADTVPKQKREVFPMNIYVSAQASSAKVMHLLSLSTGQNKVQKSLSASLKDISQMGHSPSATACAVTMHFRGSWTVLSGTATNRTKKTLVFIT